MARVRKLQLGWDIDGLPYRLSGNRSIHLKGTDIKRESYDTCNIIWNDYKGTIFVYVVKPPYPSKIFMHTGDIPFFLVKADIAQGIEKCGAWEEINYC